MTAEMFGRALFLILGATFLCSGADWTVFRMGPFEVFTDRDQATARQTLNHLEQLRWAFSYFTGKTEPRTVWPIRVVVTKRANSPELELINDAWRGFLDLKEDVPPAWNAQIVRILIEDNLGRMPGEIENGLIETLSTVEVSGTHIIIGQPPPKLTLDWARVHMLLTTEEYRGRTKVVLANLAKGVDADVAFRNGLGKPVATIDQEAKAHLAGKTVATFDLPGKPLNQNRDFTPRVPDEDTVKRLLAEQPAPDSAMALLAAGDAQGAMRVKPEWWEPYYRAAESELDPGRKGGLMKKATELAPRNAEAATAFAVLMTEYERWVDADKAWAQAERAASDPAVRDTIRDKRRGMADQRAAAEAAARREAKLAKEREIQQLRNEMIARVRKAENEANQGKALDPNAKVVEWWDGPAPDAKVTGTLERVNCQAGRFSVVIQAGGKNTVLSVRDPKTIAIAGGEQTALTCGPQRPPRMAEVEYFQKTKEAAVIRFQ